VKSLWVVYGQAGQYDDHHDWDICAYPTEKLAKRHAVLAQERATDLFRIDDGRFQIPAESNQYDPHMSAYDHDVEYGVFKLEVRDTLPSPA